MELPGMSLNLLQPVLIHVLFFLFFSLLHSGFHARATPGLEGNETDRLALLAIKARITGDPLQILRSWNESIDFCQWQGVTCGRRHKRVTMLDLHSNQLVGSIPPQIGNMSFLKVLVLHNNSFSHTIPQEIGQLFRLQTLGLENNSFGGKIPINISQCYNLMHLGLGGNKLIGKVPTELGSLSKLHTLVLGSNNLTGGIPPSFGNFSFLKILSAVENNFEGSIPNTLSQLTSLEHLALGVNKLSGMIPPSIYNLSSMIYFNLRSNQIQGSLPLDFGSALPNLETFNVYENQLSGHIPVSISNATNLVFLSFAGNSFTGKVPNLAGLHKLQWLRINHNNFGNGGDGDLDFLSSLTNCSSLEMLCIVSNDMRGVLPKSLSNFSTKLTEMELGQNFIQGSIPSGIGNLVNLEELNVEANLLTGVIPAAIGRLHKLIYLFLGGNKLTGKIPSSLGNLTLLNRLNLSSNNLEGSIPSSLEKCKNLNMILLSQNKLGGTIPKQVLGLSSLYSVDLSQNHLIGPLPSEVGHLINLGYLDVSNNKLSGAIPESLGSCITLESLYMKGNMLQGTIPPSLGLLRGIQNLDFSCNNFSGQIPKFLEGFTFLQNLNLSFNDFEGKVPVQGVFNSTSAISIIGNRGRLCGGIPQLKLPRCTSDESTKKKLHPILVLMISMSSGLLGVILVVSFLKLYFSRKTRKGPTSSSSWGHLLKVSYEDLRKATDGFSPSNLIGVGSFGSVYKGILDQEATTVAVKVLNLLNEGASTSFMAECEAWRNIRHRNLLKILSVCSSLDFQGNDFKALVYEFVVNGSLDEWLHQVRKVDEENVETKYLNLLQRLNIAIDIAYALDYLHHHCQTPVVHRDLKPSNILLDSDMTAHVGDFGLARFLPKVTYQLSFNQTNSLGIKGSIGYTAPEYGMGSEVTTYGDLYSYGILLLEMFTGKRPTNEMFVDGLNLHNFAKMALPERVMEIADPTLFHNTEKEETTTKNSHGKDCGTIYIIQECLISVMKIGVACSMELPKERMSISDAARELHVMKETLLNLGYMEESNYTPNRACNEQLMNDGASSTRKARERD